MAGIAAHLGVGHGAVTQAGLTQPLSSPGAPLPTATGMRLGLWQAAGKSGAGVKQSVCVNPPRQCPLPRVLLSLPAFTPMSAITAACN